MKPEELKSRLLIDEPNIRKECREQAMLHYWAHKLASDAGTRRDDAEAGANLAIRKEAEETGVKSPTVDEIGRRMALDDDVRAAREVYRDLSALAGAMAERGHQLRNLVMLQEKTQQAESLSPGPDLPSSGYRPRPAPSPSKAHVGAHRKAVSRRGGSAR